jgi:hypothetical protein
MFLFCIKKNFKALKKINRLQKSVSRNPLLTHNSSKTALILYSVLEATFATVED